MAPCSLTGRLKTDRGNIPERDATGTFVLITVLIDPRPLTRRNARSPKPRQAQSQKNFSTFSGGQSMLLMAAFVKLPASRLRLSVDKASPTDGSISETPSIDNACRSSLTMMTPDCSILQKIAMKDGYQIVTNVCLSIYRKLTMCG
jgi:hypothetical protein